MEVVKDSIGWHNAAASKVSKYKMWKQPLHKWDQFVYNRHREHKYIDEWSQKILNEKRGNTVAYNCGGLFFKDFDSTVCVIEHTRCPVHVPGMLYLDVDNIANETVDTLIMINPIAIKYHHSLVQALSIPGISRAGYKPSLVAWLRPGAKIFLSFSDWHLYYDRLKFTTTEFVKTQLTDLKNIGMTCQYQSVEKSTQDYVNGNVKLVLEYRSLAN